MNGEGVGLGRGGVGRPGRGRGRKGGVWRGRGQDGVGRG